MRYPELNDEAMLGLLESAYHLYESGAIVEARQKAEQFARAVRKFEKEYAKAEASEMGGRY